MAMKVHDHCENPLGFERNGDCYPGSPLRRPRALVLNAFGVHAGTILLAALVGFVFLNSANAANDGDASASTAIEVESVVLRLFEEAEVPAQEAGVVTGVAVTEGQRVKQNELLAQIDDQVPRLAADAAKAKYDITREKATNDVKIRYAQRGARGFRG